MKSLVCKIPDCTKKHKALGYCNLHYRRLKATGDATKVKIQHKQPDGISGLNVLFYKYKKSAKKRSHEFKLDIKEFKTLTSLNCYYCGCFPSKNIKCASLESKYTYNGIDRLNPNLGYYWDNCVPCCTICNLAKNTMSLLEFTDWITRVFKNYVCELGEE